ncbi:uncharacterized protein LOC127796188 isoform X2 [Diospyros lotus]|uniref:uncharacterized protein LOC127796188 isoform X2 n=1 Tax=Diospyros lotus TaxID=55363 RepID=UPI0022545414|nr:uncharacterized protein LOC127796188 isoform X2 [Diospyros lotus]
MFGRIENNLGHFIEPSSLSQAFGWTNSLKSGIVQLLGGLSFLISTLKQETADVLVVLSTIIGFLALFVGELGRRSSKVSLLKFYMFASSIAILISIACVIRNNFLVEAIQDSSQLGAHKFELLKIAAVLLGVVVQTLSIRTTVSLVGNMSPPKRAS